MSASASKRKLENNPVLPDGATAADVRRYLRLILRSGGFLQSERMCRFLSYVVEEWLAGRASGIKEYSIGLEVFDRTADYDPRTDPIVRVEARRLRAKLEEYYEVDGSRDELRIILPKGRYAPEVAAGPERGSAGPSPHDRSVAVLPFANLSSDPENEYFSDGLTEQLIHVLTKVEGLRVVAWTSSREFKGSAKDRYEIGRSLRVGHLLEGSVRRQGDRLRITVQLVDGRNGQYLWSETYDRRMTDLFAVQDEISSSIAAVLRIRLTGAAPVGQMRDVEAYNLYLQGRYYWNKRTWDGMARSVECFKSALAREPDSALAHAGLADAYVVMADYGLLDPREAMPEVRAHGERALELDPSLAEAHLSLAMTNSHFDWNWPQAEYHYRRAIALNPGYAMARLWYGIDFLALLGRIDEAFREMEFAWKLDPLSLIGRETEGYLLMLARRYQEAAASYRRFVEEEPGFYKARSSLGRALCQMGQYDQAIAAFQKARELGGNVPNILGALGQTYGLAGRRDDALRVLAELEAMAPKQYVTSSCFALVHLGLGEKQAALDWLERGCDRKEMTHPALKIHPAYDVLRNERRFQALLKRIGLS